MKAAFLSLGCKVNYCETEKMKEEFKAHGAQIVEFNELADIYVINTCTVTNIADRKSRKMLHRARRMNENGIVVACGCYVNSANVEKVLAEGVDICITNELKDDVFKLAFEEYSKRFSDRDSKMEEDEISTDFYEDALNNEKDHTRAYVKIQDGCNQFCTYCIIPFVRGKLKSRPEEEVVSEVKELAASGFKEVVITGIHVSSYGVDFLDLDEGEHLNANTFLKLDGGPLLSLLKKLNEIEGLERIRLGSLEPRIITESFVKGLTEVTKLCPHFHLSLQSGCDTVLKRMNRHYLTDDYRKTVAVLRKYLDNPAITTDIIVGFAGETEEEFKTTLNFVSEIKFADVHVFKYSQRQGTVATKMPGQVDEQVKSYRSSILIEEVNRVKKEYESQFIGTYQKVLLEEIHDCDSEKTSIKEGSDDSEKSSSDYVTMTGYTTHYLRVFVKLNRQTFMESAYKNKIVEVKLALEGDNVVGYVSKSGKDADSAN